MYYAKFAKKAQNYQIKAYNDLHSSKGFSCTKL